MPKYRGSCGCYSADDADAYGVIPAIVLNWIADKGEYHASKNELVDGYFYADQSCIAESLRLSVKQVYRAVEKLMEAGILEKKVSFKPNSTERTTWWRVAGDSPESDISEPVESAKMAPGERAKMALSIYNETEDNYTNVENISDMEDDDTPASSLPTYSTSPANLVPSLPANQTGSSLKPSSFISTAKLVFKKAGYNPITGGETVNKVKELLSQIDDNLSQDIVKQATQNYLDNNFYKFKSLNHFVSPKVFLNCVGGRAKQSEEEDGESIW